MSLVSIVMDYSQHLKMKEIQCVFSAFVCVFSAFVCSLFMLHIYVPLSLLVTLCIVIHPSTDVL